MKICVDKSTKMSFSMDSEDPLIGVLTTEGIPNLKEIEWSRQFLCSDNSQSFIDIGAGYGAYALLHSSRCERVYAFEDRGAERLTISVILNNKNNVSVIDNNYDVDIKNITNVGLIRICHDDPLLILKGSRFTLADNQFPPIIISLNEKDKFSTENYLTDIGYKIYPIRGSLDLYLADDHPFHQKKENKSDIDSLIQKHQSNNLEKEEMENWRVWKDLARHYRNDSKHRQSYDCIEKGKRLTECLSEQLNFDEELSIICYYLRKIEEGYQSCERMISSSNIDWSLRNSTLNNQAFYMKKLPMSKCIGIDFLLPQNYIASSSSILPKDDGYLINLRAVNYSIEENGGYAIRDPYNIVRTRNFLLNLNKNLEVTSNVELLDCSEVKLYEGRILGMEDIRLFGDKYLFCTYLDVNDKGIPQVCFGEYSSDGRVSRIVPLMVGTELICEKNWIPCIQDGRIYVIYKFSPFTVYLLNEETGKMDLIRELDLVPEGFGFRGSSTPISYKDGYLMIVHQVYYASPRKYFHRFIWMNKDFTEIKYGKIWFFESANIEYTVSLCHSESGLLIPYSVQDNCSKIAILSYEELSSLL